MLDAGDEIGAVTTEFIEILKMKRKVARFRRANG
jgi:hypothetical protein